MAGTLPPGIGTDQQAMQATAFIRQQPWYLQWIAARGKTPDSNGNVPLSDDERDQLRDLIVSNGIGLNNKYDGIDENGQIVEEHHKLRNTLIGAGIAGAALTGVGLAGIGPLSGLAGGAGAAGAGAAAVPATEGIASATALGLPVTAGLGTAGTAASIAGGATAAGVAGSAPNWLKTAQDLGGALGADAAGRAQGRNLDNIANIGFAQAQNDLYNSELKAPQQIASNSVRGDILSNAKDVSIAAPSDIPVPQISGGLRPSMFSDSTRQLGQTLTANAAATPMPTPTPPVLQPMETAGATDDILNTAGTLSSLAKPGYDIWKMLKHA